MDTLPTEINIVTLNCWGLKYLSAQRHERLVEIGRQLAAADPPPHIVGLQECWTQEDYRAVRREVRFVLPHGKFYHSGAFGGGLAILSRWPIEESSMLRYPLNGRPQAFFRGDWYVGKGVAWAKIRYGKAKDEVVEVFNTHTHAPYEKEPHDSYICHRTAQAWEFAKLLRNAAARGGRSENHLVVGLGDFNMVPLSLAHRIITTHAPVQDVWRAVHPDSSLGPADHPPEMARRRPIPTAEFNVRENGVTSDSVYNSWRWPKEQRKRLGEGRQPVVIPKDSIDRRGKRLDYIFVGTGSASSPSSSPSSSSSGRGQGRGGDGRGKRDGEKGRNDGDVASGWAIKSVQVGMIDRHPTLGCSLSDHFSVETTLIRIPPPPVAKLSSPTRKPARPSSDPSLLTNGAYLQSPTGSEHHLPLAASHLSFQEYTPLLSADDRLPSATYDDILAMITKYRLREVQQRKWMTGHFYASVVAAVACLVAVWFVPQNFVAFLLMLLSTLGLASGVISGLIALLFVGTELRALKEFEWEIRNAKEMKGGAADESKW